LGLLGFWDFLELLGFLGSWDFLGFLGDFFGILGFKIQKIRRFPLVIC
jgi:hypothetical protein